MVDANIYGWTYDNFNSALGWDMGAQAKYEFWENFWSRKVDSYVFIDAGTTPRLTDANEKIEAGDIVNEMMVLMNIYLKGETSESPMESGFFEAPGFPVFRGNPNADHRRGTGNYRTLNKLRKIHSEPDIVLDSIRLKRTIY